MKGIEFVKWSSWSIETSQFHNSVLYIQFSIFHGSKRLAQICAVHLQVQYGNSAIKWPFYPFSLKFHSILFSMANILIGWIGDLWINSINLARFDRFGVCCLGGERKKCVLVRKIRIILARPGLGESHDQLSSSWNHLFAIILSFDANFAKIWNFRIFF